MRVFQIVLPSLAAFAILAPATGHADPYRWCSVYSGDAGGASNCGFVTIEQCRATVSGIGGSCEPNQFYTGPERSTTGSGRYERRYRDSYER